MVPANKMSMRKILFAYPLQYEKVLRLKLKAKGFKIFISQ